jgi:hypothetical protein
MNLPNHEQARVQETKVKDYLLSNTHPEGKDKAVFFTRLGFSVESWAEFAEALIQHAAEYEVSETVSSPFGTKYIIDGSLETPDERNPEICVV